VLDESFYNKAKERMQKSLEALSRDLALFRTGRATPALLDKIKVDCYGSSMPIRQVANITVPDKRMLLIQPWDRSIIKDIEKAILKSDLGLNPSIEGNLIKIPIPPLTEERRVELMKMVKKRGEEGKVALRNIRREAIEQIKKMEKNGECTEDESERASNKIQKIVDEFMEKIEKLIEAKQKEIFE